MEITKRREIFFLSELRAIACIAIVILHTFYAASVYAPDHTARIAALTTRNLMMWAVPCFVMVSGALLLDPAREVTYRKIFRKYIPRVLAALVLFSVVFQIFDDATGESGIQFKTILYGLQNAVTGSGWKHMWYLYLITALYLLLPFYRKIVASLNSKDMYYLLSVYLVFLSLLPMLQTLTEKSTAFYICVYSVYPLYLFLGDAFMQKRICKKPWLMILLASVGTIAVACLTILSEKKSIAALSELLTSYAFPLIVLQSAGIFGLMSYREKKAPKVLYWILHQVDQCSFGVYLIHMLFLKLVLVVWKWNPYMYGGFFMILALSVGTFLCSFLCIRLLKYVPILKKFFEFEKRFDYQKRVSQMRYSFCLSLSILAILLLQKHITALHESAGTPALLYQSDFALQFLCTERSPTWLFLAVSGKRHRFREHCKSSLHVLCSRKMPALVSDIAWQEQQPR